MAPLQQKSGGILKKQKKVSQKAWPTRTKLKTRTVLGGGKKRGQHRCEKKKTAKREQSATKKKKRGVGGGGQILAVAKKQ